MVVLYFGFTRFFGIYYGGGDFGVMAKKASIQSQC